MVDMRILHISDTHGCHRRMHDLPPADIVVHSGDFTMNGSEQEALSFAATMMTAFMAPPLRASTTMCIICAIPEQKSKV